MRPTPRTPAARWARVRVRAAAPDADRVLAELWEAGAAGLEERDAPGGVLFIAYAPRAAVRALRAAARRAGAREVGPAEPVEADWSEDWKRGLGPVRVSARLVVRPPFAASPVPGAAEVVIDPRQAFGTGTHASTRLALELLDAELAAHPVERVLDAGCGSGVLALAALRLGARRAVGFDLDPLATAETRDNAERNGLAGRIAVVRGSLDALGPARFGLVVANLLRSELLPLLPGLASRTQRGGALVLSGLLAADRDALAPALGRCGLRVAHEGGCADERGDRWLALLTRP